MDEERKQLKILKITNNSSKETIYKQHKNRIKIFTSSQRNKKLPIKINIKLQRSLTSQQLKLLKIARDRTNQMEEVKFPYADMHGNLTVILNTAVKNRKRIKLKTEEDIINFNTDLVDEYYGEYEN